MNRYPVNSSRLISVGWENNTLEVEFNNGKIYQYYDVSKIEYQNFLNSPSLGSAISTLDKIHKYRPIN